MGFVAEAAAWSAPAADVGGDGGLGSWMLRGRPREDRVGEGSFQERFGLRKIETVALESELGRGGCCSNDCGMSEGGLQGSGVSKRYIFGL